MSASFNSVSFYERGGDNGLNVPRWDAKYNLVTKIIPGGDPVIQRIGHDVQRLAMPIRCTATELGSLEDSADGSSHTLTWSGGSDSAVLESIGTPLEVKPGVDMFFATLNFIRVS